MHRLRAHFGQHTELSSQKRHNCCSKKCTQTAYWIYVLETRTEVVFRSSGCYFQFLKCRITRSQTIFRYHGKFFGGLFPEHHCRSLCRRFIRRPQSSTGWSSFACSNSVQSYADRTRGTTKPAENPPNLSTKAPVGQRFQRLSS